MKKMTPVMIAFLAIVTAFTMSSSTPAPISLEEICCCHNDLWATYVAAREEQTELDRQINEIVDLVNENFDDNPAARAEVLELTKKRDTAKEKKDDAYKKWKKCVEKNS